MTLIIYSVKITHYEVPHYAILSLSGPHILLGTLFCSPTPSNYTTFDVFVVMKTQIVVLWAVMQCSDVTRYQLFGGLFCLYLQGAYILLRNVGILPHHYTVSLPARRPRLASSDYVLPFM
jgi:hypothetical protein